MIENKNIIDLSNQLKLSRVGAGLFIKTIRETQHSKYKSITNLEQIIIHSLKHIIKVIYKKISCMFIKQQKFSKFLFLKEQKYHDT